MSGVLVPPGDAVALARAVETSIADPEHRSALGKAARHHVREQFSAHVIVPRYEAIYRRVCATEEAHFGPV